MSKIDDVREIERGRERQTEIQREWIPNRQSNTVDSSDRHSHKPITKNTIYED